MKQIPLPSFPRFQNITGQTFDRLRVDSYAGNYKGRLGSGAAWNCTCSCGSRVVVRASLLKSGKTRSCGCFNQERRRERMTIHGQTGTKEYRSWGAMKTRCTNPRQRSFKDYGGRGITVCKRWLHSFENFLVDMGPCPSENHCIERKDNDLGYTPGNCIWATNAEQSVNKRNTNRFTLDGVTRHISKWAEITGIPRRQIHQRIYKLKWSIREALTVPARQGQKLHPALFRVDSCVLTFRGETLPAAEWGRRLGLDYKNIKQRIAVLGWSVERALTTPARKMNFS